MRGAPRKGPLYALNAANAVSLTGNVMTLAAVPWFVLQTTGSATKTGISAFFNLVPIVLASLFGGALVDRAGYKRMSVFADLMSAASVALIPLFHLTVGLPFWLLITLVFLGALFDTPGHTARSAMTPEIARDAGWSIEKVTGITAVIERGSRLVGAPLAGILIAFMGPANVLWVDAGTFVLSAALVAFGVPRAPVPDVIERTGYITELKEGLAFLRRDRTLLAITLTVTATNFLDSWSMVLLPLYADQVYGSSVSLGLLIGTMGAGSMVGALVFAGRGHMHSRHKVFALCFMAVSIPYPVLASFPPEAIAAGSMLVAGVSAGPLNPIIDTIKFERIPAGMRGRVFGVIHSAAWMAMPLGVLVAGVVLDNVALRTTLLCLGAAYLTVTATIWFNGAMRKMDRPVVVEPAAASARS